MTLKLKLPQTQPRLPLVLQRLSNDEYTPLPYHPHNVPVVARVRAEGPKHAARLGMSVGDYWSSRQGTAAALRALDEAWGGGFYNVPPESALDREAADANLGGEELVIDVQTHYIADQVPQQWYDNHETDSIELLEAIGGDRFKGLDKVVQTQFQARYSLAEYLRRIYLESDTTVAVLSSSPVALGQERAYMVTNAEAIGTQVLVERLGGTGRLISHSVVTPNVPGDIDMMDRWSDWCKPAGWKVYTMFGPEADRGYKYDAPQWMLDDEEFGLPFLRRARELGVRIVCAHKGLTNGQDTGWDGPSSPKDIGPAAKAFPDINFFVYHSGYETRLGDLEEGPYSEEFVNYGSNRLIKSLKDAGIGPGGNVYAELGSTWFQVMAHPREAAHLMGKLLTTLGEDNILWGTDCIFYGSPQPLIDAFRAFQIPGEYRQRYGYPQLTATAKEKILGLNAARLYGMDPAKVRADAANDGLAWVKATLQEYTAKGSPSAV